jgi:hypothetical protein
MSMISDTCISWNSNVSSPCIIFPAAGVVVVCAALISGVLVFFMEWAYTSSAFETSGTTDVGLVETGRSGCMRVAKSAVLIEHSVMNVLEKLQTLLLLLSQMVDASFTMCETKIGLVVLISSFQFSS